MRIFLKSSTIIILIYCAFNVGIVVSPKHVSAIETFSLEVLGCSDWSDFIAVPSPQYNIDARGYTEMIFNLTYHGRNPINISEILVLQTIRYRNISWNHSANREIIPPNVSLLTSNSFYFSAWRVFTFLDAGQLYPHGPYYTEITDGNNQLYWVTGIAPTNITVFNDTYLLQNTHLYTSSHTTKWENLPFIFVCLPLTVLLLGSKSKKEKYK
ncbi:MAG: hypothetical protein ACW98I_19700 [Candidatus Hodarchaeales archaeon]|jgi:hypothetical protein